MAGFDLFNNFFFNIMGFWCIGQHNNYTTITNDFAFV